MPPAITLRPVVPDDVGLFFAHMQDKDAQHMAAFVGEDPADRAAHDAHWARIMASDTVLIRTILVGDAVAGHVAKFVMFGDNEMTYWVDRAFWGQGVGTEALRQFLKEYTERPLYARAAADNSASIRVLEKCGFVFQRTERGYANARAAEIDEAVLMLGD